MPDEIEQPAPSRNAYRLSDSFVVATTRRTNSSALIPRSSPTVSSIVSALSAIGLRR
jgi:hypothetical protein